MTLIQDPSRSLGNAEDPISWASAGLCQGDSALFFPPFAERPQARVRREAKAKLICAHCPVILQCRAYGREHHEYGIWGGENETERVQAGYPLHAPIGTRHLQRERRQSLAS